MLRLDQRDLTVTTGGVLAGVIDVGISRETTRPDAIALGHASHRSL